MPDSYIFAQLTWSGYVNSIVLKYFVSDYLYLSYFENVNATMFGPVDQL